MEVKKKRTINYGEMIPVRGYVWRCDRRRLDDCTKECGMYTEETDRCLGVCFRYRRDDIVFRPVGPDYAIDVRMPLVSTPFEEDYAEAIAEAMGKNRKEALR